MDGGWLRLVGVVTTVNGGGFLLPLLPLSFVYNSHMKWMSRHHESCIENEFFHFFLLPLRCSHRSDGGERCYMMVVGKTMG